MASSPLPFDHVRETTATTGTGSFSLAGAVAGFQAFSAVLSNGQSVVYGVTDQANNAFEVGVGTYSSSGDTLSRDLILASSNSGAAVSFAAGTKYIYVTAPAAFGMPDISICQGRLSVSSTLAVPTSDITGATTLYWLPFMGNRVSLWNGSCWQQFVIPSGGVSLSLSGLTTATLYDINVYNNSGTLTLEAVAWSSSGAGSGTRATALTTQDGIYVKTGTLTKRYLGTIYCNGSGSTEDSKLNRLIWNYYNRVRRSMARFESASSWTWNTASWHQANANAANQLAAVVGVAEVTAELSAQCEVAISGIASNGASQAGVGIATNGTSSPDSTCELEACGFTYYDGLCGVGRQGRAVLSTIPPAGYNYFAWLEYSAFGSSGTTTYFEGTGSPQRSGITGTIDG